MAFNDNISGTSDDLDGSGSGFDGTFSSSQYPLDDRARLEQKIEKIREKMTHNSIAHEPMLYRMEQISIPENFENWRMKNFENMANLENYVLNKILGDLEEYLRITGGLETRQDNPQTMRIRQHFEKKNKKYSHELAQLQKKLVDTEKRLEDLDKGISLNSANTSSHSMLQNVSHGIKKTGNNLKEMTGNVIAAPFDIAYKVKKNMFGSADNLPKSVDDMGQSTFYVHSPQTISNSDRIRSSTLPHNMSGIPDRIPEPTSPTPIIKVERPPNEYRGQHEKIKQFGTEIEMLRQRNSLLEKMLADHRSETKAEILAYRNELSESRFKIQQLEQTLNETMEVHQNEVKQLKSDLNLIGTRMDYQYNDRFKRIEEAVESSNNRMHHIETSLRENAERFTSGQGLWKFLVLNGANIVVEILKIFLYLIAFILDFIRNLFVTRNRAVILIILCIVVAVVWDLFDISNRINRFFLYFAYKSEEKNPSK